MGGADLGVARDPLALNTNPAGLAQLHGIEIEQHFAVARALDVGFHDSLNPDQDVTNSLAPIADGGISWTSKTVPITLATGLFVQGGAGGAFTDVATPFGTHDDLSAKFGIVKASFGIAGRVTHDLSLGLTVDYNYARMDQKIFPGTSAPGFFGTYLRDASGENFGVRLGAQYRVTSRMKLGAIYVSKVDLTLNGHRFYADESAIGLGRVSYNDVRITGLAEPQEAGLGVSYQLTPVWLVDVDLTWLDWSGALRSSTLTATGADNGVAPQTLIATQSLNWRDQYVVALGAAYDITRKTTLWAGFNYARDPIPADTLSPLLGAIGESHVTFGVGYRFHPGLLIGGSLEYLPTIEEPSTASLPLGSNVAVTDGYLAFHAGVRLQM